MSDLVGNPEDRFSRIAAHLGESTFILRDIKVILNFIQFFSEFSLSKT